MRRLSLSRLFYRGIAQFADGAAAASAGNLPSKSCQAAQQLLADRQNEPQAQVAAGRNQHKGEESKQVKEQSPDASNVLSETSEGVQPSWERTQQWAIARLQSPAHLSARAAVTHTSCSQRRGKSTVATTAPPGPAQSENAKPSSSTAPRSSPPPSASPATPKARAKPHIVPGPQTKAQPVAGTGPQLTAQGVAGKISQPASEASPAAPAVDPAHSSPSDTAPNTDLTSSLDSLFEYITTTPQTPFSQATNTGDGEQGPSGLSPQAQPSKGAGKPQAPQEGQPNKEDSNSAQSKQQQQQQMKSSKAAGKQGPNVPKTQAALRSWSEKVQLGKDYPLELLDKGIDPRLAEPSVTKVLARVFALFLGNSSHFVQDLSSKDRDAMAKAANMYFKQWLFHHGPRSTNISQLDKGMLLAQPRPGAPRPSAPKQPDAAKLADPKSDAATSPDLKPGADPKPSGPEQRTPLVQQPPPAQPATPAEPQSAPSSEAAAVAAAAAAGAAHVKQPHSAPSSVAAAAAAAAAAKTAQTEPHSAPPSGAAAGAARADQPQSAPSSGEAAAAAAGAAQVKQPQSATPSEAAAAGAAQAKQHPQPAASSEADAQAKLATQIKAAQEPAALPFPLPPAPRLRTYPHLLAQGFYKQLQQQQEGDTGKTHKGAPTSEHVKAPLMQRVLDGVLPAWAKAAATEGEESGSLFEKARVDKQMLGPAARSGEFKEWLRAELQGNWTLLQVLAYRGQLPGIEHHIGHVSRGLQALLLDRAFLLWRASHPEAIDAVFARQLSLERTHLGPPALWFPLARAIERKFVYHSGPTNSGKTYSAMQALSAAQSGVYCGPLRLLAIEVHKKLNEGGVPCKLRTGEEVRECPHSKHTSCTVEMAPVATGLGEAKVLDVAVLDEIQMLGDERRGWAWTRAVLGIPAREVHVCGDSSALPLIRAMCRQNDEKLEVRNYERHTPLVVESQARSNSLLRGLQSVQPGDALITFSRASLFALRSSLEAMGIRCCLIYGGLPAETRREQARLFNDPDSGFDVLVATDAVGMGLNLNIRRIMFTALGKPIGMKLIAPLKTSEIKQIAGRAGRRGTRYESGFVAYLGFGDQRKKEEIIQKALDTRLPNLQFAYIKPEAEQVEALAAVMPGAPLSEVLRRFERRDIFGSRSEWEVVMERGGQHESTDGAGALKRERNEQGGVVERAKGGAKSQRSADAGGQQQQQQHAQQLRESKRIFEPVPSDQDATVADMLEYFPQLSMNDRLTFAEAPVKIKAEKKKEDESQEKKKGASSNDGDSELLPGQKNKSLMLIAYLREFAAIRASGGLVHPPHFPLMWLQQHSSDPQLQLQLLEIWHQALTLWMWLSLRMGSDKFPGRATAKAHLAEVVELMNQTMQDCFSQQGPEQGARGSADAGAATLADHQDKGGVMDGDSWQAGTQELHPQAEEDKSESDSEGEDEGEVLEEGEEVEEGEETEEGEEAGEEVLKGNRDSKPPASRLSTPEHPGLSVMKDGAVEEPHLAEDAVHVAPLAVANAALSGPAAAETQTSTSPLAADKATSDTAERTHLPTDKGPIQQDPAPKLPDKSSKRGRKSAQLGLPSKGNMLVQMALRERQVKQWIQPTTSATLPSSFFPPLRPSPGIKGQQHQDQHQQHVLLRSHPKDGQGDGRSSLASKTVDTVMAALDALNAQQRFRY